MIYMSKVYRKIAVSRLRKVNNKLALLLVKVKLSDQLALLDLQWEI